MKNIKHGLSVAAGLTVGAVALGYMLFFGESLTRDSAAPSQPAADAPVSSAANATPDVIRLGWTAWADAEVVTLMAQQILEAKMDVKVERVMTDIGIQYQAVANGDLDIMLMAWLPITHQDYWRKIRDKVINLGPLYTGRLGWVVPDYIPADTLDSISDLTREPVIKKIGGQIQGIDPGSGLMQASQRAMQAYGLEDLNLVSSSGAAMTAVLDRAIRQNRWVVATAWQPHWIFARYDLRFLKDPKGVLGGNERIHAIARQGFDQAFPIEVTEFFSRIYLTQEELAAILLQTKSMKVERAVAEYIENHPQRIDYWLSGEINEIKGPIPARPEPVTGSAF